MLLLADAVFPPDIISCIVHFEHTAVPKVWTAETRTSTNVRNKVVVGCLKL